MSKRKCIYCGDDISDRPFYHYACYWCYKNKRSTSSSSSSFSYGYDDDDDRSHSYNDTYEQRYKGDPEYDLGPDWDYDEYPPENL